MKLSKRTLQLLKNYATINPSILIPCGSTLQTISASKNILSYADTDEDFPVEFAIYDLPEFLSVVELFKDPDFEWGPHSVVISDDKSTCTYVYAEKSIIDYPKSKIKFPTAEINFSLSKDNLARLMKASNTLGLPCICVSKENNDVGGDIIIKVADPKNPSSNSYSCVVGKDMLPHTYEIYIKSEHLKIMNDDYDVSISSKLISRFVAQDGLEYYIALEKVSEYTP